MSEKKKSVPKFPPKQQKLFLKKNIAYTQN